jgi:Autotransporter beta-domain
MTPYAGITPYAAIQAQNFHTPGYTETGLIPSGFALGFNDHDGTDTRSELGARFVFVCRRRNGSVGYDDPSPRLHFTIRGGRLSRTTRAPWRSD